MGIVWCDQTTVHWHSGTKLARRGDLKTPCRSLTGSFCTRKSFSQPSPRAHIFSAARLAHHAAGAR